MNLTAELERIAHQCDTLQRFHTTHGEEKEAVYFSGRAAGIRKAILTILELERNQPEEGEQ